MTRYERGFFSKCAEMRLPFDAASSLYGLVKGAQESEPDDQKYVRRRAMLKKILLGLAGGAIGVHASMAFDKPGVKHLRSRITGGALGALAGVGIGHLSNKLNEYAGVDPLLNTVAVAK